MKLLESLEHYYRETFYKIKPYENVALSFKELHGFQSELHSRSMGMFKSDLVENLSVSFDGYKIRVVSASDAVMFALRKLSPIEKTSQLVGYLIDDIKATKSINPDNSNNISYPTSIVAICKTQTGYDFLDIKIDGVFDIIVKSIKR